MQLELALYLYLSASLSSKIAEGVQFVGVTRLSEGGGGRGGQAPVIDHQIGAPILEDLAFPLRHNNALCAALPVSQACEEGTARLSHGSHRFLPPRPRAHTQTSDSVVSFREER